MYDEREQLKSDLTRIKATEFCLKDGEKAHDYLKPMLKYIGDPDGELRDSLIYEILVQWIEDKKYFSNKELYDLLDTIISDEFLFYNIGSEGDDSVLRRSFSALLVNPIVCVHLQEPFIDKDMIIKVKNNLNRYLNEEKDLRGYDKEKGWVHALAHVSDALNAILCCEGITEDICKEILVSIERRLCEGKGYFTAEEDERLVHILYYNILEDNLLDNEYICNWIGNLGKVLEIPNKHEKFIARTNTKNFIRSLYFRMSHGRSNIEVSEAILQLERKLNIYI